jgi:GT2 family glycosyltransferase
MLASTWSQCVSPDSPNISATTPTAPSLPMFDDEPHPGCNCSRRRASTAPSPLLTPDLVIAARDRPREPELPEETLARALATPIAPRPARYDVIILDGFSEDPETSLRIAVEFAKHEHRVFCLGEQSARDERLVPPLVRRLPLPAAPGITPTLMSALTSLRRAEDIEAAVVFVPSTVDAASLQHMRSRLGWRVVVAADAPAMLLSAADIRLHLDSAASEEAMPGEVFLPPDEPWPSRWSILDRAVRAAWPRASVIVLTYDNLAFNRLCLASVLQNTEYPNYELIVVDNASTDGTAAELQRLASQYPHVRIILNDHNAGFGPGNNQGLAAATGDILVLLNNDTVVPRGWLTRLARHLANPHVGIVGPATNRTCNEAQINLAYKTYGEYEAVERAQREHFEGERYAIRMPMMFCAAWRRDTLERLGPLDEQYEIGLFEDEDYAIRARSLGLQLYWTPEVYVHHAYHASIGKLLPSGDYMRLFMANMGRFEAKWGICWERHRLPPHLKA